MSFEASLPESTPGSTDSTPETTATPEVVSPGSEAPTDVEQGGQRQSDSVPYSRFHEVNSRLSPIAQLAKQNGFDNELEYVTALQEAAAAHAYEDEGTGEEADPIQAIQSQLGAVQEVIAEQLFTNQFAAMEQQFPQADIGEVREALVYGRARDLQTAMHQNHTRNEAKRQKYLADYNKTNASRQSAAVEGAGGGSTQSGADYASMPRSEFLKLQERAISGL